MKVVIIGNGVGGVTTARILREKKTSAEISIFTQEPYPYYPRPRLIEFLQGNLKEEQLFFYSQDWYERNHIQVNYETPVKAVFPREKSVELKDGKVVPFDYLVISSGSRANIPPFGNLGLPGIFSLRTLSDAKNIKEWALSYAQRVLVVGGGLLGLESAFALSQLGKEVIVLDHSSFLLSRQLDREGASLLKELLEKKGLEIILNASCESFWGEKRVEGAILKDSRRIPGDMVLISAGVQPETDFLKESGILLDKGVVVNDQMRTNFQEIYAVGDVAQWRGKIWGIIPPALDQALVAASSIAGEEISYEGTVPSNILKVVGLDLMTAGDTFPQEPGFEEIRLENKEKGIYLKIVWHDNLVVGFIALGSKQAGLILNRIVQEKKKMSFGEARSLLEKTFEEAERST
jgi:nitrite reductase (NADH) large subunit